MLNCMLHSSQTLTRQGLPYSALYHACHRQLADQLHLDLSSHMINMHRFRNRDLWTSLRALLYDLLDQDGGVLPSQKVG